MKNSIKYLILAGLIITSTSSMAMLSKYSRTAQAVKQGFRAARYGAQMYGNTYNNRAASTLIGLSSRDFSSSNSRAPSLVDYSSRNFASSTTRQGMICSRSGMPMTDESKNWMHSVMSRFFPKAKKDGEANFNVHDFKDLVPLSQRDVQGRIMSGSWRTGGMMPDFYIPSVEEMTRDVPLFAKIWLDAIGELSDIRSNPTEFGFELDRDGKIGLAAARAIYKNTGGKARGSYFDEKMTNLYIGTEYNVVDLREFYDEEENVFYNDCRIANGALLPLVMEAMGVDRNKVFTFYGSDPETSTCSAHQMVAVKQENGKFTIVDSYYQKLNGSSVKKHVDGEKFRIKRADESVTWSEMHQRQSWPTVEAYKEERGIPADADIFQEATPKTQKTKNENVSALNVGNLLRD